MSTTDGQSRLLNRIAELERAHARTKEELEAALSELQKSSEYQTATAQILELISRSSVNVPSVFGTILETAVHLCEAECAFIFQQKGTAYRLAANYGFSQDYQNFMKRQRIKPGRGTLVGRTALAGHVVHIPDVLVDPEYTWAESQRIGGFRTVLGVPLLRNGVSIGVFALARSLPSPFIQKQIKLVQTFADQAVIAIENARLFKALVERTEEVEALNETLEARVDAQVGELERLGRLKRFLSPPVAEAVISAGDEKILGSHRAHIAVLFCDIRGFTTFCETAEPEETIEVLQTYHDEMGRLITSHRAGVDHRMGDGIMVIFNDPLPCDDPAGDAVRLAVAMRERMGVLCNEWGRIGYRLGFGVGISLGYATVGMVGSEGRFEYTASGTTVNLSARLCDEAADGEILISPRAYAAVEDAIEADLRGELDLKGIQAPVQAHQVLGRREN